MSTISLSPDWQRKKCPSSTDLIHLFKNLAIWFFLWPVSWSKGTFSRGRNCISGFQLLQLNNFPFSCNSHFQIYKILLPWCDSSFVLSTIIPITTVVRHPLKWKEQEKSGAEQFGFRFDFASNLNLPLKISIFEVLQEQVRMRQGNTNWLSHQHQPLNSIFPPQSTSSFQIHLSSALCRAVPLFKVILTSRPGWRQACSISQLLPPLFSEKVDTAGWIFKIVQTEVRN